MLVPRGTGLVRMRSATADDLVVGLTFARDRNEPGRVRDLEAERDEALAAAVLMEAELACAMEVLTPAFAEIDGSETDTAIGRAAVALASGTGAQHMLGEYRTMRALAHDAMTMLARLRLGKPVRKSDGDDLLARLAQAFDLTQIVVD